MQLLHLKNKIFGRLPCLQCSVLNFNENHPNVQSSQAAPNAAIENAAEHISRQLPCHLICLFINLCSIKVLLFFADKYLDSALSSIHNTLYFLFHAHTGDVGFFENIKCIFLKAVNLKGKNPKPKVQEEYKNFIVKIY